MSSPRCHEWVRFRHGAILGVSFAVVVLAFALTVKSEDQVQLRFLENIPLPDTCMSRKWLGVPCPGCGLTRSFILLAQGDFAASLRMHRLGWLMAAAVLVQFPYRTLALVRNVDSPLGTYLPTVFGLGVILAPLGNWLLNLWLTVAG